MATVWSQSRNLGSTATLIGHVVASMDKVNDYSAWWLWTSSKFSGKKSKKQLENGQLLSGCGFVQYIAPLSLSRDGRIKMDKTNKQGLFYGRNTSVVCGFIQYIAPLSLSRDGKIKMEQNKQTRFILWQKHISSVCCLTKLMNHFRVHCGIIAT